MSLIEKALGKARAAALEAAPHAAPQSVPQAVPQAVPQVDTGATTARQRALQMPPSRMAIEPDVRITDSMLDQLGLRASPEQDYQRVSEYRHIKRNLLGAIRAGEASRVILVTSALAGEGKSFSAANLARTLALEPDYVVLLVDADVAKPHITNAMDLLERKGLMNALTEPGLDVESLILTTDIEGLSILPAGGSHEHATEHLASERMRAVVELLQEVPNRIIVIDSLPILLTTEARVLAPLAGQVLDGGARGIHAAAGRRAGRGNPRRWPQHQDGPQRGSEDPCFQVPGIRVRLRIRLRRHQQQEAGHQMKLRDTCMLVVASSLVAAASAAEPPVTESTTTGLDYTVRAGLNYSDNIGRYPSPLEESASAAVIGFELNGERPVGNLRYDAAVDIARYQYLNYFSGGDTFGRGRVSGSYGLVDENFRWNASLTFDQMRDDLFRPVAPGNLENEVTFSTGPTIRGELFGAMDTQLDGNYERAWYSGSTIDNQTIGARLQLGRRTGPQSSLGLGGAFDDVSYLGGPLSSALDFQRTEGYLYGEMNGIRTHLSGQLGYSQAEGDSFAGDGPLIRVRLERKMSPYLSAYLGYRDEYPTSQTGILPGGTPANGGVINSGLVTSSPREARTGEIGFNYDRTRSRANIGFYHLDEQSLIVALGNHKYDELRVRMTRRLTPRSTGTVEAAYSHEEFSAFAQKFDELMTGLNYTYELTRSLGLEFRVEYRNRDDKNGPSTYDEFSGGVYVRYTGSLLGRSCGDPEGSWPGSLSAHDFSRVKSRFPAARRAVAAGAVRRVAARARAPDCRCRVTQPAGRRLGGRARHPEP